MSSPKPIARTSRPSLSLPSWDELEPDALDLDDVDPAAPSANPGPTGKSAPRFPVGSRARVIANSSHHDYSIGATVEIHVFDENDRTYQGREAGRRRDGNWIQEADLAPATELDWTWLQTVLPEEDVLLLRAFEGLERLTLSPRVRDTLVSRLPGLKSAILRVLPTVPGGVDAD